MYVVRLKFDLTGLPEDNTLISDENLFLYLGLIIDGYRSLATKNLFFIAEGNSGVKLSFNFESES